MLDAEQFAANPIQTTVVSTTIKQVQFPYNIDNPGDLVASIPRWGLAQAGVPVPITNATIFAGSRVRLTHALGPVPDQVGYAANLPEPPPRILSSDPLPIPSFVRPIPFP